jgi:AdoMet-dependent rRNA methyltransferase SPB1
MRRPRSEPPDTCSVLFVYLAKSIQSWCQVAVEAMPSSSLIIGVDLAPIKPISRVITFQSDITTDKCRSTIRRHLKTWKADTVLHDGAPNVGVAWVQDAFSQAELALQALRLATDFLIEGGTFVTKVFRSKDYNALLWVFNQLFTSVDATKPPSSRNVSAEIFVVCRGFKAPKRIDPKFLDARFVFAELLEPTPNNEAKVFNPEIKKRRREGYEEGDYTQHKEISVTEFIQTSDPIAILGSYNKLSFQQNPNGDLALVTLDRMPETTQEIKECCEDLKVLGRKEFRILLRWRLKVRDLFGLSSKRKTDAAEGKEVAEVEPMDNELALQQDLERLHEQETSKKKKSRRKDNERKQKEIVRMQMNMTTPMEIGQEQAGPNGDGAMFALKAVDRAGAVEKVARGKMGLVVEAKPNPEKEPNSEDESTDDEEDHLDRELESMYEQYQEQRDNADAKQRAKRARKSYDDEAWEGVSNASESSDEELIQDESSSEYSSDEDGITSARLTEPSVANNGNRLTSRAALFFDQDIFRNLGSLDIQTDGDSGIEMESSQSDEDEKELPQVEAATTNKSSKKPEKSIISIGSDSESSDDERGGKSFEIVRTPKDKASSMSDDPRTKTGQIDVDIVTAEAMALAQSLATGEKTKTDVIDDGFNKLAFRDTDGLPEWFLDDEGKHSKPNRPITAAAAAAIRDKLRALNARPIKKVREAKSRKKFKAGQKLEKLRKKSALLVDEEAMTEKDKAQSIARLMSRAAKKKPKQSVKLVVARGGNRGIAGRPRGVKGKYKIVDPRLKKDVRAEKRLAKKKK